MAGVDVVIPNYNYGRYLRGCVASILSQAIPETRIMIIDNASSDDSVEIIQEIIGADSRVELVARRKNLGSVASFNEGLDWARSEYFVIMCADDLAAPGAFARSIAIMERYPGVGLAYGRGHRIWGDCPPPTHFAGAENASWCVQPGRVAFKKFCRTGYLPMYCCSTMMRTAVHKQAGYYRSSLPQTEDFELWMRMTCFADVAGTDAVQGVMRVHDAALSKFTYEDCRWDFLLYEATFDSFFAHEGGALPGSKRLRRTARRGLAARAYWSALARLCRGEWAASRDLLRYAIQRAPLMAVLPPLDHLLWRDDVLDRVRRAFASAGERIRPAASETLSETKGR